MFIRMKLKAYKQLIARYNWRLLKAGKDWKLVNEYGKIMVLNIIIPHPPGNEIAPYSVKKTYIALKLEGKDL